MTGLARDLLTPATGEPVVLAVGGFEILTSRREIVTIDLTPPHPRAQELVGVRAGGASRLALSRVLGDIRGTPTYQLLDDFAGASLVAGWIWLRWMDRMPASGGRRMVNVCTGFAEGASSLDADGFSRMEIQSHTEVGPQENPEDPEGWHVMPVQEQRPQQRRTRRIDLWREGGLIKADVGFQDSGSSPLGGRTAVHEYRVFADIDEATGLLTALQSLPLILPYAECPGAAVKAQRMIGRKVAGFREDVPETLSHALGCTHLNDVLRSLADVPALARLLPRD